MSQVAWVYKENVSTLNTAMLRLSVYIREGGGYGYTIELKGVKLSNYPLPGDGQEARETCRQAAIRLLRSELALLEQIEVHAKQEESGA